MAALVKRRNGTYYAQWTDVNRTPWRRRLTLGTSNKAVAKKLLGKLDDAYQLGSWDPWLHTIDDFHGRPEVRWTLDVAIGQFLTDKRKSGLSKHTLTLYRSDLTTFADQTGNGTPLERLPSSDIDAFVRNEKLARSTQRKRFRVVRAFLNWCEKRGYLTNNPITALSAPKTRKKAPRIVRLEDLELICAAIRQDFDAKVRENGDSIRGRCEDGELLWMIPLLWFALYTGMRISELARLRWSHIDFQKKLIYIYRQKNGSEQTIPLNASAKAVLSDVASGEGRDYVFRSPRGHRDRRSAHAFIRRVSKLFVRYRRAAGLPEGLSFHGLRHAHCTLLAEAGKSAVVIRSSARHANIQTSMCYVHLANESLKSELDDVFG